jgi:hypothetical protein
MDGSNAADGFNVLMVIVGVVILALALAWGTTRYRARRKDGAEIAPGGEIGHNFAGDKPRRTEPAARAAEPPVVDPADPRIDRSGVPPADRAGPRV